MRPLRVTDRAHFRNTTERQRWRRLASPLLDDERRNTLARGAHEQRRRTPRVELWREEVEDLVGAHAVEVVVEVELLDDGDEAPQVAGAVRRGAAFRAFAPLV